MRLFTCILLLLPYVACNKASTQSASTATNSAQVSSAVLSTGLASAGSVNTLLALYQQYNPLVAQLQIEQTRNQNLVTMLEANQNVSCLKNVTIKTVQLNINGEMLAQLYITDQYQLTHSSLGANEWNAAVSNQSIGTDPSTGDPIGTVHPIFTIALASFSGGTYQNRLQWTYDESKAPMFVMSGEKTLTPTSTNVTIGQIDTLIIQKNSIAYIYSTACSDGSTTCNTVSEDQRYHLTKVTLIINGITIYEADIEHFFAQYTDPNDTSLQQAETAFTLHIGLDLNTAYLQALQIQSCAGL